MKNHPLLLILLFFATNSAVAQKDTCTIGLYFNSLYDFNLEDKSFMADFWMWMNYKNDSLKFDDAIEIPDSKTVDFSHYNVEKKGNINWATQKCKVQVMYMWDVTKFPFDRQYLHIELEDAKYDATKMAYLADTVNSKIDSSFTSKEWRMEGFKIWTDIRTHATTYGNPELTGSSSYPRLTMEVVIHRNNSWLILTKMLTGAYVAFLISCLVFFVSSENQDSRFGLCVGGLFAAIGNKYIVESVVPASATTTLMDNVHTLTFTFILLIVGIIIISLFLYESGDEKKKRQSIKLDKWAFFFVVGIFMLFNVFFIWRANS